MVVRVDSRQKKPHKKKTKCKSQQNKLIDEYFVYVNLFNGDLDTLSLYFTFVVSRQRKNFKNWCSFSIVVVVEANVVAFRFIKILSKLNVLITWPMN